MGPTGSNRAAPSAPARSAPWTRRLADALRRYVNDSPRRYRVFISVGVSIPFVLLLLYYSHGELLYRVDFPGVYSIGGFLLFPSANYILPAISAGLSDGNPYVGQYLLLFFDAAFCTYGAQLLVRELFPHTFTERQFVGVQVIASALYLVNPYNVTWGVYALTLDLFLNNAAFFLVLTMAVRLLRGLTSGKPFRRVDAAMLGIGLGLAAPTSFPDVIRTLVIESILLGAIACVALVMVFSSRSERRVALVTAGRFGAFSVPVAAALIAYPFYEFLTRWLLQPGALVQIGAKEVAIIRGNTFNTLVAVIRLLGRRNFEVLPYYPLYTHNLAVIAGTWFWPLLALAVPLLLSFSPGTRDRVWVLASELILLPCLIWGTGTQPPFGSLNSWIAARLPLGKEFMPPFFPMQLVAIKIYCVLIAFSIGVIYLRIVQGLGKAPAAVSPDTRRTIRGTRGSSPRPSVRRRGTTRATAVATATCLGFIAMLMVASLPIFEGTIFDRPRGLPSGFDIPASYFAARKILHDHGDANALLLPAVGLYVGLTWGYSGATGWYTEFNYPSGIVVPAYYGPYAFLLNSTKAKYLAATTPLAPGPSGPPFSEASTGWHPVSNNSSVDHYALNYTLDLTNYTWLEITFPTTNPALLIQLISSGEAWIGLHTNRTAIGWYLLGQRGDSPILPSPPDSVTVALVVNGEPRGNYSSSDVNGILLKLPSKNYYPDLGLSSPTLVGVKDSVVQPVWLSLMSSTYHVRYLLVDLNVRRGETETKPFVALVLNTLSHQGLAEQVLGTNTSTVQLWALTS